jgi:hypothetical protein
MNDAQLSQTAGKAKTRQPGFGEASVNCAEELQKKEDLA